MILKKYILKRFFLNFFSINIGITLLFSLIEFFEKMVRIKQATTGSIFYFILLSSIPIFFENFPVSAWLASCLTLKEMDQQNECTLIKILNIDIKKILSTVLIAGILISIFSFVGTEILTNEISKNAEQFKQKNLKQKVDKQLFNKWFMLDEKKFCHVQFLDIEKNEGRGLSILDLLPNFKISGVTTAQKFSVEPKEKVIFIPTGKTIYTTNKKPKVIINQEISIPSFFTQIQIAQHHIPINKVSQILVFEHNSLPNTVYNQLLYIFLKRLLIHLLPILYVLLTFLLFFIFMQKKIYKWISILIPYPTTVLLFTITDSVMQAMQNGLISIIPYVILTIASVILYMSIRKHF